jgi:predicted RNA-binding protein Jag
LDYDYDSGEDDLPDMSRVPVKPSKAPERKEKGKGNSKAATVEDAKEDSDSDVDMDEKKTKAKGKGKDKGKAVQFESTPAPTPAQEQDTLPRPFSEEIDPEDQETFQKQVEEEEDAIADRMSSFLANPVFSMKVFLSSHFRDKGLIWWVF